MRIASLGLIVFEEQIHHWIVQSEHLVFEGAQGILLDAEAGFYPYTSWTDATPRNALELLSEHAPHATLNQIGVLRCYSVRHGPGPLPTETNELTRWISDHNHENPWQGKVRYGWFDPLLSRYALQQAGKVNTLAVTHLDVLSRLSEWKYCSGYHFSDSLPGFFEIDGVDHVVKNLGSQAGLTTAQKSAITGALEKATPVYRGLQGRVKDVIESIESLLEQRVGYAASGPSAADIQIR